MNQRNVTRNWYVVRTLAVEQSVVYREYMSPMGSFTRVSGCAHVPVAGSTEFEAMQLLVSIRLNPDWQRFTHPYLHHVPAL